jgi:hypothetical protein
MITRAFAMESSFLEPNSTTVDDAGFTMIAVMSKFKLTL